MSGIVKGRVKKGANFRVAGQKVAEGTIVDLTPRQVKAFKNQFELVGSVEDAHMQQTSGQPSAAQTLAPAKPAAKAEK